MTEPHVRRLEAFVSLICLFAGLPAPALAGEAPQWRTLAPAPTPRTEAAAVALDGEIYLIGGYAPPAVTVPLVEIYDPQLDEWRTGPPLPVPVNHAAAAVADGTIYVFGGFHGFALGSQFSAASAPTAGAYALRDGSWEAVAPLPAPRAAGGAAAIGKKIYVVGGVLEDGSNAETTLVYDVERDEWTESPGLPFPRQHLGVAAARGDVYALGGRYDLLNSNVSVTDRFAPASGRWKSVAPMPTARGGLGAATTGNGLIVTVGGEGPSATYPQAEAFSVARNRWSSLPPLPTPRHGLGVVAVGNTVYAIAGGTEPSYSFSTTNEAIYLGALRR
jgi:non-specific serine/threonine protein kinase